MSNFKMQFKNQLKQSNKPHMYLPAAQIHRVVRLCTQCIRHRENAGFRFERYARAEAVRRVGDERALAVVLVPGLVEEHEEGGIFFQQETVFHRTDHVARSEDGFLVEAAQRF